MDRVQAILRAEGARLWINHDTAQNATIRTHRVDRASRGCARTLAGTQTARQQVAKMAAPQNEAERTKAMNWVAKVVSEKLENTPAVALKSYIHASVLDPG